MKRIYKTLLISAALTVAVALPIYIAASGFTSTHNCTVTVTDAATPIDCADRPAGVRSYDRNSLLIYNPSIPAQNVNNSDVYCGAYNVTALNATVVPPTKVYEASAPGTTIRCIAPAGESVIVRVQETYK